MYPENREKKAERLKSLTLPNGWKSLGDWVFRSPSGSLHDLSAADMNRLDYIEQEGLFLLE